MSPEKGQGNDSHGVQLSFFFDHFSLPTHYSSWEKGSALLDTRYHLVSIQDTSASEGGPSLSHAYTYTNTKTLRHELFCIFFQQETAFMI
jgi:hypothetical protein